MDLRLPNVGWVSTWNSRCGIATYSNGLLAAFSPNRLMIFANRDASRVTWDEAHVRRVWTQGWDDPLQELTAALLEADLDAVVIQFNFGLYDLEALMRLLRRLHEVKIRTYIMLHSTMDVIRPDRTISLTNHLETLRDVDRLFVHSIADLNRLKSFGLVENVTLFPHGFPAPPPLNLAKERPPSTSPVIATFGFLLPNKGLQALIRAFALLRRALPDARLMMLTARYPAGVSEQEEEACRKLIAELELEACVALTTDFLEEEEILKRLGTANVVVYPYQNTQESASGAIKLGVSSLTPVAHTPSHIFSDVAGATYVFESGTPEAICYGLRQLLADSQLQGRLREAQEQIVAERGWGKLSRRLLNLLRGDKDFLQYHLEELGISPTNKAQFQAVGELPAL